MINYLSSFVNTNTLGFPNTLGVNATGGGATNGTEFVKLFVDDIWGRFQAILDYAGLAPDGITEAPGASQHIEALQKGFAIGPGIGVDYWKSGDPALNGDRVLLLRGQGVLRTGYPALDSAVYVGDSNNAAVAAAGGGFYHADNSDGTSPNTAGIYLILPDTRGTVIRDEDPAASIDPDGASRVLGDFQAYALQGHWHKSYVNLSSGGDTIQAGTGAGIFGLETSVVSVRDAVSDGVNGTPQISSETRMANTQGRKGVTY